ncbi:AAA family ATPase [Microbacterium sp. 22195]|uniref:AAA family ATPase n=1 Tax=Microbacterium sp. 22195 TaxID=3453891 RepID=UPI003F852EBB
MRIVVSGTHASGKSTLISDFALRHPGYTVLADPFDSLDEASDSPGAAMFIAQLRITAERLREETAADLIAERGPIDFLAYVLALAELSGTAADERLIERAYAMSADAMRRVDLLVVLPLSAGDGIRIGAEEHPELRDAMNDVLLELLDDPDLVGADVEAIEITGDPRTRLALLEHSIR